VSPDAFARIFVVDDEPVIASTLTAILRMNGFSARFFTSPLEALTAARTRAPDLLISDITMPDISGIELAIRMKAQYPNCKVLLFSGHPASLTLLEDARAQGHDFRLLMKPVPPGEFLSEIVRIVDGVVPVPPRSITLPPHRSSHASKHRVRSEQL
jgi:DNA-binding NtrC family response regulator